MKRMFGLLHTEKLRLDTLVGIACGVLRKRLHDRKDDRSHWQTLPPAQRIAALEQIRRKHHG